ncbi:MAG: hypothetical protein QXX20_00620 [Candidatus Thermoplasmatota archaeon]
MEKYSDSSAKNLDDDTFDLTYEEIRNLGYQFAEIISEYYNSIRTSPIVPLKSLKQLKLMLDDPLHQTTTYN